VVAALLYKGGEMTIHICRPICDIKPKMYHRYCPDCKQEQDTVEWHYEWYGWNGICLFCGIKWEDNEYQPLNKNISVGSRRWKNIQYAKELLKNTNKNMKTTSGSTIKKQG